MVSCRCETHIQRPSGRRAFARHGGFLVVAVAPTSIPAFLQGPVEL
jgi:hypothetical protein